MSLDSSAILEIPIIRRSSCLTNSIKSWSLSKEERQSSRKRDPQSTVRYRTCWSDLSTGLLPYQHARRDASWSYHEQRHGNRIRTGIGLLLHGGRLAQFSIAVDELGGALKILHTPSPSTQNTEISGREPRNLVDFDSVQVCWSQMGKSIMVSTFRSADRCQSCHLVHTPPKV